MSATKFLSPLIRSLAMIRINKFGVFVLACLLLLCVYYFSGGGQKPASAFKESGTINLRKLLIASIQAAQFGGKQVLKVSESGAFNSKSKGKTKEGANDPVTDADFNSHCVMELGLHRIFKNLRIVSEEHADASHHCSDTLPYFELDPTVLHETAEIPDERRVPLSSVTVWIDPLDATQEFTETLWQYVTTMVCVAIDGKAVIGVIHNPFTGHTTWAWDTVAFSEDLVKARRSEEVKNPIIIVSRSHAGSVKELVKGVFGANTNVITAAGAGYKVLQVVFNNATAYLHTTAIKKWDLCAGNAILNSLGGQMTDLSGEQIDYRAAGNVVNEGGLLATFGRNHDDWIERLKEHKKIE